MISSVHQRVTNDDKKYISTFLKLVLCTFFCFVCLFVCLSVHTKETPPLNLHGPLFFFFPFLYGSAITPFFFLFSFFAFVDHFFHFYFLPFFFLWGNGGSGVFLIPISLLPIIPHSVPNIFFPTYCLLHINLFFPLITFFLNISLHKPPIFFS